MQPRPSPLWKKQKLDGRFVQRGGWSCGKGLGTGTGVAGGRREVIGISSITGHNCRDDLYDQSAAWALSQPSGGCPRAPGSWARACTQGPPQWVPAAAPHQHQARSPPIRGGWAGARPLPPCPLALYYNPQKLMKKALLPTPSQAGVSLTPPSPSSPPTCTPPRPPTFCSLHLRPGAEERPLSLVGMERHGPRLQDRPQQLCSRGL